MSLFHLRLLKPHTHAGIARAVGEIIHIASSDVAALLDRLGVAERVDTASVEPPPLPSTTDTDTTGDNHE